MYVTLHMHNNMSYYVFNVTHTLVSYLVIMKIDKQQINNYFLLFYFYILFRYKYLWCVRV